jgi:hypothetical protein
LLGLRFAAGLDRSLITLAKGVSEAAQGRTAGEIAGGNQSFTINGAAQVPREYPLVRDQRSRGERMRARAVRRIRL